MRTFLCSVFHTALSLASALALDPSSAVSNSRDELKVAWQNPGERPEAVSVPAGSVWASAAGSKVICLRETKVTVPPHAPAEAKIPTAALSTANARVPEQPAKPFSAGEPRLAPLLKFLATQPDAPRSTSQCVVLALMENINFAQWLAFQEASAKPDEVLVEAVDALGILQTIAPGQTFRLAQDPELKLRALHAPLTRAKAGQLYGLAIPGDVAPGQVAPNLGQLLHTKPGDNCPICRMRAQMQAPQSDL